jgi:hypothetical protein
MSSNSLPRQPESRFNNDLRYRDAQHPNQTQITPAYVLEPVRAALGGYIDLDPCTIEENPTGAETFVHPPQDGLAIEWAEYETIYVNPPYGKAREPWVQKCIAAAAQGCKVVLLIPSATDTRIFQAALASADACVFPKGRIKFEVLRPNRRRAAASHPSALIGWNVPLAACSHLGLLVPGGLRDAA